MNYDDSISSIVIYCTNVLHQSVVSSHASMRLKSPLNSESHGNQTLLPLLCRNVRCL